MIQGSVQDRSDMEETDVAIIGAGFSGLCMGIRLKQDGRENFTILEQAGDVGGVWRDNTYPGCACDVPSPLYSYSFEQQASWSQLYAPHDEIHAYIGRCADKYGVREHIQFNTQIISMRYDEAAKRWTIEAANGRRWSARILVAGLGGLNRPSIPAIPGLETFQGPVMHSAEWRHDVDLRGKRVAVVGTGASAIQIVPSIQPEVAQLDLYQRTPPWVMPKADQAITPKDQAWLSRNMWAQKLIRKYIFMRSEMGVFGLFNPKLMRRAEKKGRAHIAATIKDPALREKLTPNYTMGCKRILLSNVYYPALAQPNTHVIANGITQITPTGIIDSDGVERPADVIVWCTGFKVQEPMSSVEITGLGGRSIKDDWEDGAEGYFGVASAGYPNFFFLVGPNTGLGHNSIVYVIETQVDYIARCLDWMAREELATIAVSDKAHKAFNLEMQKKLRKSVWQSGCDSWYTTDGGKVTAIWPGFSFTLRNKMSNIRKHDFDVEFLGDGPSQVRSGRPDRAAGNATAS